MMRNINNSKIYLAFSSMLMLAILFFTSCETDITLDLPQGEEKIVVEGHIEPGMPPLILLTRSQPYFSAGAISDLNNSFVRNANVTISNGIDTVTLLEIRLSTMPDSIAKLIGEFFQVSADSAGFPIDVSIYTTFQMLGEEGKTYVLDIKSDGKELHAVTTIPPVVAPDSIWFEPVVNPVGDSLWALRIQFQEPANQENYYRYYTKRNAEPFYPDRFRSVIDDKIFNGMKITWTLTRGENAMAPFDPLTYGYFNPGDTVVLKYCTMDKAHYDFWATISQSAGGGGPGANPVIVISNVQNGLGIWGGFGSNYQQVIAPE